MGTYANHGLRNGFMLCVPTVLSTEHSFAQYDDQKSWESSACVCLCAYHQINLNSNPLKHPFIGNAHRMRSLCLEFLRFSKKY